MKVKIGFEIKPFIVPNFVVTVSAQNEELASLCQIPNSIPLSELDPEMLDRLCDDFRAAVFEKAGALDRHK